MSKKCKLCGTWDSSGKMDICINCYVKLRRQLDDATACLDKETINKFNKNRSILNNYVYTDKDISVIAKENNISEEDMEKLIDESGIRPYRLFINNRNNNVVNDYIIKCMDRPDICKKYTLKDKELFYILKTTDYPVTYNRCKIDNIFKYKKFEDFREGEEVKNKVKEYNRLVDIKADLLVDKYKSGEQNETNRRAVVVYLLGHYFTPRQISSKLKIDKSVIKNIEFNNKSVILEMSMKAFKNNLIALASIGVPSYCIGGIYSIDCITMDRNISKYMKDNKGETDILDIKKDKELVKKIVDEAIGTHYEFEDIANKYKISLSQLFNLLKVEYFDTVVNTVDKKTEKKIIKDYLSGDYSMERLSAKYKLHAYVIENVITNYGENADDDEIINADIMSKFNDEKKLESDVVYALTNTSDSVTKIASNFGVGVAYVNRIKNSNNIEKRPKAVTESSKKAYSIFNDKKIIAKINKLYLNQRSIAQISKEMNLSEDDVRKIVKDNDMQLEKAIKKEYMRTKLIAQEIANKYNVSIGKVNTIIHNKCGLHECDRKYKTYANKVRNMYDNGMTVQEISKQFDMDEPVVKEIIDYYEMEKGILRDYQNKDLLVSDIEERYGVTYSVIKRIINANGIEHRV